MSASKCDKCGEIATDIDTGFSPGLHAMRHDCGGTWRVVSGAPPRYTLIEYMPLHLRDSHARAGNSGVYPQNGAVRLFVVGDVLASDLHPTWAEVVEDCLRELPPNETAVELDAIPPEALAPDDD